MKRARWLTTRSQARWMQRSGIIGEWNVVEPNWDIMTSIQHPNGYEVCRIEAEVLDEESVGPEFHEADVDSFGNVYDNAYHNEFEYVDE